MVWYFRFKLSLLGFFIVVLVLGCNEGDPLQDTSFSSDWRDRSINRQWAGEDFWLNPLQAWRQKDGWLRCEVSGGDRNAVLLTRAINNERGSLQMSVDFATIEMATDTHDAHQSWEQNVTDGVIPDGLSPTGWVGFQLGLQGQFDDYRDDAIKGIGLCAGVTTQGRLFIGDLTQSSDGNASDLPEGILRLKAIHIGEDVYRLTLTIEHTPHVINDSISAEIHASWLPGLVALTCSQSIPDTLDWREGRPDYTLLKGLNKRVGGNTYYAFKDWRISGSKVSKFEDRSYGPILWTQHTLSDQTLKMSAQFVPIGSGNRKAALWVDGQRVQESSIDTLGRNALFRVQSWDDTRAHSYEVRYLMNDKAYAYSGIIQPNSSKETLRLAALSCVDDRGFPHQDLVDNVAGHGIDLYTFHGDQLYERVAGYGVERSSILDYLRKWYIFGWSFRDLMRNTPTIIIPDDHDVFHGNLWGNGGKAADTKLGFGYDAQDSGGYKEPPEFVNMVHRTQTGHLPDPFDPSPVLQNISVYYTDLNYRGVSFAILGDRQWKSAPRPLLPKAEIENGWPQNKSWNAKTEAFHPDAELLGSRQEAFLEKWTRDWNDNTNFKVVISQSPFCNVATLPAHIYHDKYVPGLKRYRPGDYPKDDRPVADFDANAWPQNKRDKAIKIMRKAYALHITGDQHLGSTGQYGVDEYGDSGYWVATPAVSNLWPRRWFPAQAPDGGNEPTDPRRNVGNYEDGFGNKITVKAVANPYDIDREPAMVFDKAPGYTIVDFEMEDRSINIAVWPRWAGGASDPPDNKPFAGWPITIDQEDNYGRKAAGYLKSVEVNGRDLIEVIEESSGEVLYTIRPAKGVFTPKVFDLDKTYTLRKVGQNMEVLERKHLKALR